MNTMRSNATYLRTFYSSYGILVNQVYHYVRYVQSCEDESWINKAFVSCPCLRRLLPC